jgi:MFS family permease
MALFAFGNVILFLGTSLIALAVGLLVMGLGQIINLVAGQAMIANRGPRDRREHRYGWYSTAVAVGQLSGPSIAAALVAGTAGVAVGGGTETNLQAPVFAFSSGLGAAALVLALFLPHQRPRRREQGDEGAPPGLGAAAILVLRRPGMASAMLVSITVISAVDVLVAYLPAYGEAEGLGVETIGALLTVRAASSLVSRLFMPRLIDLMGRGGLLATSMVMAGGAFLVLPFASTEVVLFGLMIVMGLGLGLGQPMTIAWVANRSPRSERALALGVRVTGNRAALLIVPALMGAVAGAGGLAAIWIVLAGILGFGAVVARRTPFDELVLDRSGARYERGATDNGVPGAGGPAGTRLAEDDRSG